MDKGGWPGGVVGFVAWLSHEFGWSGLADGVPVNHLWFIVYIAVYSLVAVVLWRQPGLIDRLGNGLEKALTGYKKRVGRHLTHAKNAGNSGPMTRNNAA